MDIFVSVFMSGDKTSDTTNPRRISYLPIEFRSSGRGFTQDLRAKNQCTTGDTNGSSLRWDISRHSSDLQRRLAGEQPDLAPLLTGLLGCDGAHCPPGDVAENAPSTQGSLFQRVACVRLTACISSEP